jgi:hypothetical protein
VFGSGDVSAVGAAGLAEGDEGFEEIGDGGAFGVFEVSGDVFDGEGAGGLLEDGADGLGLFGREKSA